MKRCESRRIMDKLCFYYSPLGKIILTSNGQAITGLWFENERPDLTAACGKGSAVFDNTKRWLDIYFMGKEPDFTPPIFFDSTPFRNAVWNILLDIPYGHTVTYGQIAAKIAKRRGLLRMSAQAVGGAVGKNPISIIVPCHRVIGSDGSLVGYAGGLDKKSALLELEKSGLAQPNKKAL